MIFLVSFLTCTHYFSRCMSKYEEYLTVSGYPLSEAQWDICDQQNHQTYTVKDITHITESEINGAA
jgi:hypothetical protein